MNLVNRKTFILLSKIETSSIATYIKRGKIIMENNMFDLDNQINIDTINKINSRKIKSKITFCKKECKFCNQVKYKKEFLVINNKRGKRLSTLCANCLHEKNLKQKEISKEKRKAAYKKSYLKRKSEISKKKSIRSKEKRRLKNEIILRTEFYKCDLCLQEKHRTFFYKKNPLIIKKKCHDCTKKESFSKRKKSNKLRNEKIKQNPVLLRKKYDTVKTWRKNNKEKINNYIKNKTKNDTLFAFTRSARLLICNAFKRKNAIKIKKTVEILGCSIPYFKKHIESNFKDGMSWINRNKWHIDHKKPLCTAKTIDDIIELNHYTNLQPLWAIDNLKKGGRYANN